MGGPWLRIVTEIVVIVASILLAFGIDAWWDTRGELEREREVLAALEHDMAENRRLIESAIESHGRTGAATQSFLESTPDALGTLPPDSAAELARALFRVRILTPLQGAMSGEDLSALRGSVLRTALGTWSGLAADQAENRPLLFSLWATMRRSQAYIRGEGSRRDPVDAGLLQRLRSDGSFSADLEAVDIVRSGDLGKLRRLLDQTDVVLALLRDSA